MSSPSFQNPWVFTLGILGNIVSFMVYLAPVPTFYRIFKRKSTEGFHSFPYVASLFSAMLWIYYATIKSNMLLLTINSFGCFIEGLYIVVFVFFAPKKARILTLTLVILLDFVGIGLIITFTKLLANGSKRTEILGWLCVALAAIVYLSPLSIMKQVIRTKSVEFMPFWLSFSLVLSAVTWFFYGLLLKDLHVEVPNVLGFIFGVIQMLLYFKYKKLNQDFEKQKLSIVNMPITIKNPDIYPVCTLTIIPPDADDNHEDVNDQKVGGNGESDEDKEDVHSCIVQV